MAGFATLVLTVTLHAMGNVPIKQADCSAKNTVKKTEGFCECRKSYVWDDSKSQCALGSLWCRKNFAKNSSYLSTLNECACKKGFELNPKGDACVKAKPATTENPKSTGDSSPMASDLKTVEVTLDDTNVAGGTYAYDFESAKRSVERSPDLFMGGVVTNGKLNPTLSGKLAEMKQPFAEIKECPETGYISTGVTGAYAGKVYCLKTAEGNYAKFEVLDARYDAAKQMRVFTFKSVFQPFGSLKFE